jgi:hypothetical protein
VASCEGMGNATGGEEMSTITPYNVLTGRTAAHRDSFLQVGDSVLILNGHDANKLLDMRKGTAGDCGLSICAAPAVADGAAGVVTGSVRYRCRWVDQSNGAMSAPGAETAHTTTDKTITVTKPTGTPPARATHWIVERTTDGGRVFWPVNRSSAAPYGAALSDATVSDNVSDSTLRNRQGLSDNQGVLPVAARFGWASRRRGFVWGRRTHVVTATVTNGNTAVTGGSGFTTAMVGQDLAVVGDVDGKTYRVAAYVSASALTLAENYAGTTGSKTVAISGAGDVLQWSEPNDLDSWGIYDAIGQPGNRLTVGDDGEAGRGGCGLGDDGELLAKRTRLFVLRWGLDPDPVLGDGRLVALPVRRGCVGPMALRFINGYAYGIDYRGIWRMAPGGLPVEIGAAISHEWRRTNRLNWLKQDNWHIGYDPANRQVWFFVCEGSDTYPKRAWVWDEDADMWIGARTFHLGCTCTIELPDTHGIPRMVCYFEASGSAASYARMQGLGVSRGANVSLRNGTVTSGGASSLACTGAGWTVNGAAGAAVTLVRAAGTEETQTVVSNTADTLTTTAWTGAAPIAGDTFRIGSIPARYRTGRLTCGDSSRKKQFTELWVWTKYKSAAQPFKIKARFDGNATPTTDFQTLNEDGVSATAAVAGHTIDPTVFRHRFRIPLHELYHTDMQLEILSDNAGDPWEIMGLKVLYRWDDAGKPRDK